MTHNHDNESAVLVELADVAKELGDMSQEKQERFAEAVSPEKQSPEAPEPAVIKLDTEDSLRLENMMLRNKVAKMSVTLAENQAKENQEAFQNHLIVKLGIDSSKYQMQVNSTEHTVAIVPR